MLKLLLNHWQVHREPAPFVITDDPLYCAHLSTTTTTTQLPEVYSVNRVNPIFEDDEEESLSGSKYSHHKRTHSENETRSSDDTGYISGPRKIISNEDDCFFDHHMSSDDSDELPKSVIVSADVHREPNSDDTIDPPSVRTVSSCTYCTNSSRSSGSSPEPYDSLTASNDSPLSFCRISVKESMKIGAATSNGLQETEVKTPIESSSNMDAREKLEKLLQHGNEPTSRKNSAESHNSAVKSYKNPEDVEKTKNALMKSLTRAIHNKVPTVEGVNNHITRTDSTIKNRKTTTANNGSASEAALPSPSERERLEQEKNDSVTRRDESVSTNSSSAMSRSISNSRKLHRHHKNNSPKPITLHQLLPGHWSYDNIYLPQMPPGICYHCLHHHNPTLLPVSEKDLFYTAMYHHSGRSRHSWAPQTMSMKHQSMEQHSPHSSKGGSSTERRYSPDGSSQETESDSQRHSEKYLRRKSAEERRSLRVPKRCKCEDCLSAALDSVDGLFPQFLNVPHTCPCCYLPHRRVKFASDTDLSKHHQHAINEGHHKQTNTNKLFSQKFPINLHRLNGHVKEKSTGNTEKDEMSKSKTSQSTISRGQKEPIKMDDLYRSYPINFQDWEAHYRRKFLLRRRKRALNMIGMAIGIILVVGVAIAMTFIFLRLKRPT